MESKLRRIDGSVESMAFEQNASVVTVYRSMVTPDITPNVVVVLVVLVVAVDTTDVDSLVVLLVVAGNFL